MSSISKITVPVTGDIFSRKRLFTKLDNCLNKPAVCVSAPAGSGKTTLITSYIDTRKLPCIWYQIDKGDDDIATFFYYMGLAAKKAAPRKSKPLPLLTPEYLQDIPTFTQRYFENLYGRLKSPFVVVFDNYHEVPERSPFHDLIRSGLTEIPEGINIILATRGNPPSALAHLRASNMMDIIGWSELRLTPEESQGIMSLHSERKFSEREVKLAYNKTGGWAAGLILLLERAKMEDIKPYLLSKHTPEEIFDYFAEEILNKIDKETQNFLFRTAFLQEIIPHIAEKLTGVKDAGRIMSELNYRNCFTERRYHSKFTYQYHPLFREFLLTRARKLYNQTEISQIQFKAAGLLEEAGQTEEAIRLYIETDNWKAIVRLIIKHAQPMVMQGRSMTLQRWLSSLPDSIIANTPYILYWMGICRMPFSLAESRAHFENAFKLFRAGHNTRGIFLSWSGVVETFLHELGNLRPLDKWIAILDEILRKQHTVLSEEIDAHVASRMFGALAIRQPAHPRFNMWKERAFTLLNNCSDTRLKMLTGFYLCAYHIWIGDYRESIYIIEKLRTIASTKKASPLAQIMLKVVEAWQQWLSGSFKSSISTMSDALRISRNTGVHIWDYRLMIQGVAASLSSGDVAAADDLLRKMGAVFERLRLLDRCYYHYEISWHSLLNDNLPRAVLHQEKAMKLSMDIGLHYAKAQSHLAMAHLKHELAHYKEASRHLNHSQKIGRQMKSQIVEYSCLLTKAQFTFDRGNEKIAVRHLRGAMTLGREQGYVNFSWWRPSFMSHLCTRALESGIEAGYVHDLIRQCNLTPNIPLIHMEKWPWPVKIYTLGRFEVIKDGCPVKFSRKIPKKPLDMLRVLIALGGVNVSKTQLSDILWPDAEGDAAHKAFGITLIRLRELIGLKEAIRFRGGCVTIDQQYCYIDIWAFEYLLKKADAAEEKEQTTSSILLLEKALALYKGHFFGSETEPWSITIRERLRDKFLRHTEKLCRYREKRKEWKKAVACYKRGLEVDDLIEEFYQRLIICYQQLGRRADALSVYRRCKKTLLSYGIKPSPETERIYERS